MFRARLGLAGAAAKRTIVAVDIASRSFLQDTTSAPSVPFADALMMAPIVLAALRVHGVTQLTEADVTVDHFPFCNLHPFCHMNFVLVHQSLRL